MEVGSEIGMGAVDGAKDGTMVGIIVGESEGTEVLVGNEDGGEVANLIGVDVDNKTEGDGRQVGVDEDIGVRQVGVDEDIEERQVGVDEDIEAEGDGGEIGEDGGDTVREAEGDAVEGESLEQYIRVRRNSQKIICRVISFDILSSR